MTTTQTPKAPSVIVWTRLRPREKRTLQVLSEKRGVPQALLLGLAVRRWLRRVVRRETAVPVAKGKATKAAPERRNDVTWARMRAEDKEALAVMAADSGQSECLLVRRAFLWWIQQGAPE